MHDIMCIYIFHEVININMIYIDNKKIKKFSFIFSSLTKYIAVTLEVQGSIPRLVLNKIYFF